MITIQINLSNFYLLIPSLLDANNSQQQNLTILFRLGSIKLNINLSAFNEKNTNYKNLTYYGGKRLTLDISKEQFQEMLTEYAVGLFLQLPINYNNQNQMTMMNQTQQFGISNQNNQSRFFSILSLKQLYQQDRIQQKQLYFLNDFEEKAFKYNFSINLIEAKNPRLPNNIQRDINNERQQNYNDSGKKEQKNKTFNEYFVKPAVPGHQVKAKKKLTENNTNTNNDLKAQTLTSFLYGNNNPNSGKIQKNQKISSINKNNKNKKISQDKKKPSKINHNYPLSQTQKETYFQSYDDEQQDNNPPMMQFTNTTHQPTRKNSLQAQLQNLHVTSPQFVKLQHTINQDKIKDKLKKISKQQVKLGGFNKNKTNNAYTQLLNKFQQANHKNYKTINSDNKIPSQQRIKLTRQQLQQKAKKQLSSYPGQSSIQIPLIKNGKLQYVPLSNLTQQQIKTFALQQRQRQNQQLQRKQAQKKLKLKEKQNQELRLKLLQKEKSLLKERQENKKKQIIRIKENQLKREQQERKRKQNQKKQFKKNYNSEDSQQEQKSNQYDSQEQQQKYQQQGFQSFLSQSQKQSRLSISSNQKPKNQNNMNSKKQQNQSSQYQYNSNDFDSYTQSMSQLDSQSFKKIMEKGQKNRYQSKYGSNKDNLNNKGKDHYYDDQFSQSLLSVSPRK